MYQSNVAETYQMGIEGYRKLRALASYVLRHSRLKRHVERTRYTYYSRLGH